ncbi:hypothetical protein ACH5RR_004011 [Cinchona calisaya]|uniref:Mechanosensitive ion channel protein n=1 Tax=Cinchona calisaya TaxID=153742 RepID=A0ABD3AWP9_9GENT
MEGEKGIGMIPYGGDNETAIPILVSAQASDHTSLQGGSSRHSETSEDNASNGKKSTNSQNLRRRLSSRISESDSTLSTELQLRALSMRRAKFSQTKSRVLEVEESNQSSSTLVIGQGSELRATSSNSKILLSEKIKSMRAGSLQNADENSDEDDDKSDHTDDDDEEVEDQKDDQKNGENAQRLCEIGKKLKAIDGIIEWIVLTCVMAVLIASLYAHNLKTCIIWGLEIWKWCVLVAVIFCGRLVTKWAKDAIVFLIETKFLFNEKVVYFLHGVKQSVRVVIWLALVLLAWFLLIDRGVKRSKKTTKILSYITKALASSLIGAVMWMVKTLLVKLIAASFHVKTFFEKIREAISDEYVLWTLSVPPSLEVEKNGGNSSKLCCPTLWSDHKEKKEGIDVENQKKTVHEKSNHVHKKEEITLKKLGKMKPGKMPASTMGHLIDRIRSSKLSVVSNAVDDNLDDGGEQKDITSRSEAEEAASFIFKNVIRRDFREYIKKSDLLRFMNKENGGCLLEWFQKVSEEGKITKEALTDWTVNIFKQREYLSHSLKDAKTAIEELNRILSGVVLVLIVVVWLLMMGFATTKVLVFFSSQILVVVFIFGNTCRAVFEAMVFVFVMHPFDVGDRCVIDGVQMIVEEMDILKTAFLRYDNEMIYYPNAVLATKAIGNFNRSPEKMGDTVNFDVDVSTSSESIEALKAKIKEYIEGNSHWHPDHSVQIKEIENMNKMKMSLLVNHKMNFQNFLQKLNRRTELMLALKKIFEEIGIKYHLLPQELHVSYIGSAVQTSASLTQTG